MTTDLRAAIEAELSKCYDSNDECRWCQFGFEDEHAEDCAVTVITRLLDAAPAPGLDGAAIRDAIGRACSLTNPRLSEVDWEDVAAALAPSQPEPRL